MHVAGTSECGVQEVQRVSGPIEGGRGEAGEGAGRDAGGGAEEGDGEAQTQVLQGKGGPRQTHARSHPSPQTADPREELVPTKLEPAQWHCSSI